MDAARVLSRCASIWSSTRSIRATYSPRNSRPRASPTAPPRSLADRIAYGNAPHREVGRMSDKPPSPSGPRAMPNLGHHHRLHDAGPAPQRPAAVLQRPFVSLQWPCVSLHRAFAGLQTPFVSLHRPFVSLHRPFVSLHRPVVRLQTGFVSPRILVVGPRILVVGPRILVAGPRILVAGPTTTVSGSQEPVVDAQRGVARPRTGVAVWRPLAERVAGRGQALACKTGKTGAVTAESAGLRVEL
jgi:hypothetical protein